MQTKIKLQKIQLIRNIVDTDFFKAYKKLVLNKKQELSENEIFLLLKFAVIFINEGEKELEKFGYKIILKYSTSFNHYQPLYDIAINKNYIPVAKFIEDNHFNNMEENFHRLLMSSYKENYRHIQNKKSIYFSAGQKRLYEFSKNILDYIVVAPTSYGKSELIIHKVEENLTKKICIIVPTKSLLAQTRKNLIRNNKVRQAHSKVVTHPDMLSHIPDNIVAVLTQERLLRLLQKHKEIYFDIVLIDEAHNLIENNPREILTVQDLRILKHRNNSTNFYYFTPFLVDPKKIKIFTKEDNLLVDKIHEFIKVEQYYCCDLTTKNITLKLYDQFFNKFFDTKTKIKNKDEFDFISRNASTKNIIYINRPKNIESFAVSIKNNTNKNKKIEIVQKALSDFLHKDYNLISTLDQGVVYHHGGMPEYVRLYVENAFSKIKAIQYIVTSSTLLQGVNIPAEKIFLLDTKKGRGNLNAAQFKNLTGRVCRFSEVFNKKKGSLKMLLPNVYVVKSRYSSSNANIDNFLKTRVKDNKVIDDIIENPLIKHNITDLTIEETEQVKEAEEYQENIESGSSDFDNLRKVESTVAKSCFENNIHDFDIFINEKQLTENYNNSKEDPKVSNPDNLIFLIAKIFLWKIKLKDSDTDNFKRLQNDKAKSFYAMFLGWRASGKSYNELIKKFLWHWDNNKKEDLYIYVGSKWGEETSPYKEGFRDLYIDLSKKSYAQKINIAIIRIKEEQDFIDFKILPYVEILNDLNLIEENFYNRIKYGTDDKVMIKMLKEGFSIELAKTIKHDEYSNYIKITESSIQVEKSIVKKMEDNDINEILIFEIQYHIN